METKYYIVTRIDGDYAWLSRTDTDNKHKFTKRKSAVSAGPVPAGTAGWIGG